MLSDLTFLTNEPERKLSARLNDLLARSKRFDCLVGYFYLSGFYLIQKSLEPCEKVRILIGLETERKVDDARQRGKIHQTPNCRSSAETTKKFIHFVLKQRAQA